MCVCFCTRHSVKRSHFVSSLTTNTTITDSFSSAIQFFFLPMHHFIGLFHFATLFSIILNHTIDKVFFFFKNNMAYLFLDEFPSDFFLFFFFLRFCFSFYRFDFMWMAFYFLRNAIVLINISLIERIKNFYTKQKSFEKKTILRTDTDFCFCCCVCYWTVKHKYFIWKKKCLKIHLKKLTRFFSIESLVILTCIFCWITKENRKIHSKRNGHIDGSYG